MDDRNMCEGLELLGFHRDPHAGGQACLAERLCVMQKVLAVSHLSVSEY